MGLFDIFTNDSAEKAANANRGLYSDYGANAARLFSGYGADANAALDTGVSRSTGALDTGLASSTGALTTGLAQGTDAARGAINAFTPLSDLGKKYGTATSSYLDALGVNGPEGVARAKAAFTTGPGYDFQVGEAIKGVENSAAARGGALSGNALAAVNDRASGIAKQEYGSFLDRLGGFVNPELSATSGAASGTASGYKNLGDMISSGYTGLASLYGNDANARAGIYSSDATNRVGVAGNVVSGQNAVQKDLTSGLASANNAEAQAAQNGSANFWNGLFSLGGNAAKGFFGGPATPKAA